MTDLKIGLALGGGGSKGAFQLGVWQAFRELGVYFDAIAGTSIGSINGAFMAVDDYDGAVHMWENLQLDQCLSLSEDHTLKSTDLLSFKNANVLAHEMLSQRGLNTTPLRALLGQYIDEKKIRNSPIEYGLMTALIPSLKPQPRWIRDIPENQLIDYLMASAKLPGLQKVEIEGKRYIDGGFAEAVPISMLKDRGIRRIVAVDLSMHAALRSPLLDNIEITYIHDRQDLGAALDISPNILKRNRRLGYLDTLKAYGRLNGEFYSFKPADYNQLLQRFGAETLNGLEQAASAYDIDRGAIYPAEEFIDIIHNKRHDFEIIYERSRQALKIEHKTTVLLNGRLKALKLVPAMRLAFLMELSARAKQNDSLLKLPMQLFHNVDLAAKALLLLEENIG